MMQSSGGHLQKIDLAQPNMYTQHDDPAKNGNTASISFPVLTVIYSLPS